jgi:hypothetical protein
MVCSSCLLVGIVLYLQFISSEAQIKIYVGQNKVPTRSAESIKYEKENVLKKVIDLKITYACN